MPMTAPAGLARKSVGAPSLWTFGVTASSPMTVLAGGIIATYAATQVVAVPLSFLVLCAALALFTVGYVAMSRHVPHAATMFALLARGLGRVWGVAGAVVALLAYNCIQISLYGLFGATLSSLVGGPWWVWSLIAWAGVALLGVLHVAISVRLLATLLVVEIGIILLLDFTALANPAGGQLSLAPLMPNNLLVDGLGGVLALGIAAFVGYEMAPVYAEETRDARAVPKATFLALFFLGLLYALSAWALAVATGPENIVAAAQDPGSGLPFSILEDRFGVFAVAVANLLLITSVFAAMLSFHSTVARYVFALSRERLLPHAMVAVRSGSQGGAPVGGSLLQSAIAALLIISFAIGGADPFTQFFTWLSTIAAMGIMLLMTLASFSVVVFFAAEGRRTRLTESAWTRVGAPLLGGLALAVILTVTVVNVASLLGVAPGSPATILIPGSVALAALAGAVWGIVLRQRNREVYLGLGYGRPHPLAVPDHQLRSIEL